MDSEKRPDGAELRPGLGLQELWHSVANRTQRRERLKAEGMEGDMGQG
ncbi:MAG: hypothetical protein K0U98_28335 [Deltaproteobacteria bacterium]|nr:hypothetical protein [Deltaproteobacteria bacterium]